MTSLWHADATPVHDDPLTAEDHDVLVVGAGLTGLTTALLLARAGRRVAVLEARTVGAVATGNTTAKLSALQGTHLSRVRSHHSAQVTRAYVQAQVEGVAWLARFCEDHDVALQRRTAYTFALKHSEVVTVEREHAVAAEAGLPVTLHARLDERFPVHRATGLADQAQFDPMDVLAALVAQVRAHGGTVHQGHRVTGADVAGGIQGGPSLDLADGRTLRAREVVLATGGPLLDRGLHFAKMEAQRSYALAFRTTEQTPPPDGMYLSAGSDSRSVRDVPRADGRLLLIGGAGHGVGRTRSEAEHVDRLRAWTAEHYPGAVETHHWSAQDYAPADALPYVGLVPRGGDHLRLATGYEKWGMSNAVAASLTLAGQVLGAEPSWAQTLHGARLGARGALQLARMNLGVGAFLGLGAARGLLHRAPDHAPEGTGDLGRAGLLPTGRTTGPEGEQCAVVGICTHLGGVLKWNDAERSWDCPLHGSRFAPDGAVLEGPATQPLKQRG
ncbi:Glycine/D-amino acid oxidase [Nocardioides scoriae]|uniref:Glycine/D-amino acid oxidase n=1 Tax=Nocardioides scoriae TaxID=642780 RepID=A0A1H1V545_9ACTN|nr:FAD-dependent oxidoreductase [Nocardioides scoriae]SDS79389.1 Glycine/D-amino acid oxidase [Nocardioides scoriae]